MSISTLSQTPDFPEPPVNPVFQSVLPKIESIEIQGSPTPAIGRKTRYIAIATFENGDTMDISNTAGWTSSNIFAATIDEDGVLVGRNTGFAGIRAGQGGVMSEPFQISVMLNPPSADVTSIEVTGPDEVEVGSTGQFTATATLSDGSTQDITDTAVWESSDEDVATISSGILTAVAEGETDITATQGTVASEPVSVSVAEPAELVSLAIDGPTEVVVGTTIQYTVTATYSDESTADVTDEATWQTSDLAVATISDEGLLKALTAGEVNVRASYNGVSAAGVDVTVTAAE